MQINDNDNEPARAPWRSAPGKPDAEGSAERPVGTVFRKAASEQDKKDQNPRRLDAGGDLDERVRATFGAPATAEAERAGAEAGAKAEAEAEGSEGSEAAKAEAKAEAPHGRDNGAVERDGVDQPTPTPIQAALARIHRKQASAPGPAARLRPVPVVGRKPPPGRGLVGSGPIREKKKPPTPKKGRGGPSPSF